MPDVLTKEQRHRNMVAIHSSSSKPEVTLRHFLWGKGFRYRVNDKRLPGSPDIVLPKYRTTIFVHGCFWHGHKDCKYYTIPQTNTDFWTAKIARNQERDQEVWRQLETKGWFVIIVWECQLKKTIIDKTVELVQNEIIQNGILLHSSIDDRRKSQKEHRLVMKLRREREKQLMEELKKKIEAYSDK